MNKTVPAVSDEQLLARVAAIICEETCGLTSLCKSREAARALFEKGYLSAALAAQGPEPVVMKALEWQRDWARSSIGDLYEVASLSRSIWQVRLNGTALTGWYPTQADARAVAEAHYAARFALTTPAQPVGVLAGYQRRCKYETAPGSQGVWEQCSSDEATDHFKRNPRFEYRPIYAAPQPPAEGGWKPISTLKPTDGMIVMGYGEYRERDGFSPAFMRWYDSVKGWNVNAMPFYPSHWMPLPPAPANGGNNELV